MQPAPQSANGIQYGPQEFEFYQQLFVIANPDGRRYLNLAEGFKHGDQRTWWFQGGNPFDPKKGRRFAKRPWPEVVTSTEGYV